MPRRCGLTQAERAGLLAFPEAVHPPLHLLRAVIRQRRSAHNRLGFAVQLCYLRHPGFALPPEGEPPPHLLEFIGHQLRLDPALWPGYTQRPETRREHLAELQAWLHLRSTPP